MWVGFILKFRYLATVVILVLLAHAVGFLALGVIRAVEAYELVLSGREWAGSNRPGIHIAESVDALLLTLVLIARRGVGATRANARVHRYFPFALTR